MLFWILLVAGLVGSAWYSYKNSRNWLQRIVKFVLPAAGSAALVFLVALFGGFITHSPTESDKIIESTTYDLREMTVEGVFDEDKKTYLISERDDDGVRLSYAYSDGDVEVFGDLSSESAVVSYGEVEPRLDEIHRQPDTNWIAPGFMRWYVSYEFHLPEDSVVVQK